MDFKLRSIAGSAAVVTAAAALMTAGLADFDAAPASAETETTYTTPGTYTWTVPTGVTRISVKVYGAQGGGVAAFGQGTGGHGAMVTALVPVTPGQTLTYVVGGQPTTASSRLGGYGGGGNGADAFFGRGAGGGGASSIYVGTTALVVAGGGGGAAEDGVKGGDSGRMGGTLRAASSANGMGGERGLLNAVATTPGGNKAVLGCPTGVDGVAGQPGSAGQGGEGGGFAEAYTNHGGGGGGGGYVGGAGGGGAAMCAASGETAAGGGGGGGSSYVAPWATAAAVTDGYESGNGAIVIAY